MILEPWYATHFRTHTLGDRLPNYFGVLFLSRLGKLPGVEQQAHVHFGENLACDGSQQLHCLLEMGFLVLSTCGAVVCLLPNV